jgi:hypothetical protein
MGPNQAKTTSPFVLGRSVCHFKRFALSWGMSIACFVFSEILIFIFGTVLAFISLGAYFLILEPFVFNALFEERPEKRNPLLEQVKLPATKRVEPVTFI